MPPKKRDTDTGKWADQFFRGLPPEMKCFYQYINDNADNAGVWKVDLDLAAYCINGKLPADRTPITGADLALGSLPAEFRERIYEFGNGEYWYNTRFLHFHYGDMRPSDKMFIHISKLIESHGLRGSIPLPSPFDDPCKPLKSRDDAPAKPCNEAQLSGDTQRQADAHTATPPSAAASFEEPESQEESVSRVSRGVDGTLAVKAEESTRSRKKSAQKASIGSEVQQVIDRWLELGKNPKDYTFSEARLPRFIQTHIDKHGLAKVLLAVERIHQGQDLEFLRHIRNAFGREDHISPFYAEDWKSPASIKAQPVIPPADPDDFWGVKQ